MSYLNAIEKVRREILMDNERPMDVLIRVSLRNAVLQEVKQMMAYRSEQEYEYLMGMKIEWTKPKPLTHPQISIRTDKGDLRIVNCL